MPIGVKLLGHQTRVMKTGGAANTTTIIHTVTAGKTFYLEAFELNAYDVASGETPTVTMIIRDGADATVYSFVLRLTGAVNGYIQQTSLSLPTPIAIAAGYDVVVVSDSANCVPKLNIIGYEQA